jgi:hypothetical protein
VRAGALRDLASHIASACAAREKQLFCEAVTLFRPSREEGVRWLSLVRREAFNELAVAIFRSRLPDYGFQFGSRPHKPGPAPACGIASTWREGDAHAAFHEASTPALALLRAAMAELSVQDDALRAAACSTCGGSGWSVNPANGKQICRHEHEAA